ncbi:carboxypeptidase-like protein [Dyadobacter jejuensis]|uniref:Carboxypeptidase-like protein n=1 Tax=Dyadobacter jejuensis TaxID=1082580 RepID=A0A316AKX8_9BACT|nr:carboxypeptidase-like regulatory domain-containing protein [Dyadobacter jejuensis]PWJ58286.1 carboxypeptidase-like protein [Dyadobacter jejuensis]
MMHTHLSEARLTLLVLFFLFFQVPISQAQSPTVTLVGKVTDQKTGQALPFANVFINNSSIGTTTDEHGAYKLVNLPIGSMEVAVSFLGYTTIKQTLRYETGGVKTVPFQMREGMELEGVTIYSKRSKKRERYLKIIAKELLGQGRFSKQCRLVNPEVLRIRMEDNGHLTAQTRSPLIIENLALGYIIHQDLDDFDFYEGRVYYGGSTRFELLDPKTDQQKAEWRANQKEAYKGSLKQVLTAMVADSLSEYGFRVFQEIPESLRMFSEVRYVNGQNPLRNHLNNRILEVRGAQLIQPGELPTERLVVSQTKLEIFDMNKKGRSPYTDISRAYTQITLPNGYFIITPEGWVVMPMGFEIAGDLGSDRFSNLLPADWKRD